MSRRTMFCTACRVTFAVTGPTQIVHEKCSSCLAAERIKDREEATAALRGAIEVEEVEQEARDA